jgi:hypothetical protein
VSRRVSSSSLLSHSNTDKDKMNTLTIDRIGQVSSVIFMNLSSSLHTIIWTRQILSVCQTRFVSYLDKVNRLNNIVIIENIYDKICTFVTTINDFVYYLSIVNVFQL